MNDPENIACVLELARDLNLARTRARDLDRALGRGPAFARAFARRRALDRALDYADVRAFNDLDRAGDLARDLDLALARDRNPSPARARAQARARARALKRALDRDHPRDSPARVRHFNDLSRAVNLARDLDQALERARGLAPDHDLALALDGVLDRALGLALDLDNCRAQRAAGSATVVSTSPSVVPTALPATSTAYPILALTANLPDRSRIVAAGLRPRLGAWWRWRLGCCRQPSRPGTRRNSGPN